MGWREGRDRAQGLGGHQKTSPGSLLEMERQTQPHLPFSSRGYLPDPWIELRSPTLRADSLPSEPPGNPLHWECGVFNHWTTGKS